MAKHLSCFLRSLQQSGGRKNLWNTTIYDLSQSFNMLYMILELIKVTFPVNNKLRRSLLHRPPYVKCNHT